LPRSSFQAKSLQISHSKFAEDIILWRNVHLRFIMSWYGLCKLHVYAI